VQPVHRSLINIAGGRYPLPAGDRRQFCRRSLSGVDNQNRMNRYRTLLALGAVVLLVGVASLVATGALRRTPPTPTPAPLTHAPILCAPFGGCDILERFVDGSQAILPLRLMSYTDAEVRCEYDLEHHSNLIYCTAIQDDARSTTVGLAFGRRPPSPSPTPPSCTADQLELVGVFNDCGAPVVNTSACEVRGNALDVVVQLHGVGGGTPHDYLLYLHIGSGYHGPDTYANSNVSAMVREYVTGALWQSLPGVVLRVSGADGRSGTVKAALSYVGGESTPPAVGLNISGPWRCV
jgi:hypothetical protein